MNSKLLASLTLGILLVGYIVIDTKLNNKTTSTETIQTTTTTLLTNSSATSNIITDKATTFLPNANTAATSTVYNLELNSSNTVLLLGEIGANSMNVAQEIQRKAKHNKQVWLLIDSPGGSVFDGAAIVTAVQNSKTPVNTVCISGCMSMAAIIFSYGKERYMVDRSVLMFHEASGGLQGPFNQMKTRLKFFDRFISKFDYEIATRAGVDPQTFRDQMPNELWFDSRDAVESHFADKLASVTLDIYNSDKSMADLISKVEPLKEKITINVR